MKILVINAGSSSLKYQLIDMKTEQVLAKGLCERIGMQGGNLKHEIAGGAEYVIDLEMPTHKEAFVAVVNALTEGAGKVIDSMSEITAVGHRVVNGSELFPESILVSDEVLRAVESISELAPLHVPPQLTAIKACREVFGKDLPMSVVFDTSFHRTMPRRAFMFGIPYEYYEKYSIRRYGFHGTSHKYVAERYFSITGAPAEGSKIITCHLGNGSSITAVKDGKSIDTSMGFTPTDGFIMGTRCGGIDPSIVNYIMKKEMLNPDQASDLLNKKSGFIGLSGLSSDNRDIRAASEQGNDRAKMTLEILVYQIKKIIGGYAAAMNGVDAVIFTGGIGENDFKIRQEVCGDMEYLGLQIDFELNKAASRKEAVFSTGKTKAMVIPTNEEFMIARDTKRLITA